MDDNHLEKEKERLAALSKRIAKVATIVAPEMDPAEFGAIYATAFEMAGVRLSVYIVESWKDANACALLARERLEAKGEYLVAGSNGSIFFFGHTPHRGQDVRERQSLLADMASSLSGEE